MAVRTCLQSSANLTGITFLVLLMILPMLPAAAFAEISVSYSFPMISPHEPPSDRTLEGSQSVAIVGDGPIRSVGDPDWLTRISSTEYSTVFLWNETAVRQVRFVDSAGDTTEIILQPRVLLPLNLENHQGPVVHIQTAPENLWDQETGIYVWGNHNNFRQTGEAWERPAIVQYYDENGVLVFSEQIGLRINGQSSRNYEMKGLRLYFDHAGSSDSIDYDFFGYGPTTFERLVLRGNKYPDFAISSAVNEPLHMDLGHNGSRHRSVEVYLNNEAWGAYSLRERLDDEFVEKTWQFAGSGQYTLIKDHEAEVGHYNEWEDFLADFAPGGPFDSHQWFEETSTRIDLVAYIDWLMINVCGATSDNMAGKNLAILKLGSGPWQYLTWDEDILYQSGNLNANHLRFYSAGNSAEFSEFKPPVWYSGGPWPFTWQWNNMLRALMQNAQFKSLLRQRAGELLDGPLSVQQVHARIDSISVHQRPQWVNHGLRWACSPLWYPYKRDQIKTFVSNRHPVVVQHLADFLEYWSEPVELVSFSHHCQQTGMILQWTTERESDCEGFLIQRSIGTDSNFETIASWNDDPDLMAAGGIGLTADYSFTDAGFSPDENVWYRLLWESDSAIQTVLPWIESNWSEPILDLRLNEFMALNNSTISDEFGEYDDWLEIINPTSEAVSVSGLYLSDNFSVPNKWALPDTVIAPNGFLLVWCDSDMEQGPLHAGFKLAAAGEEIGLFSSANSGYQSLDSFSFGAQQSDVSLGRLPDGNGPWQEFIHPTPGSGNAALSSIPVHEASSLMHLYARPNPFNPSTDISFELSSAGMVKLQVVDVRGRLVKTLWSNPLDSGLHRKTWDGRGASGQKMASGLYFALIVTEQQRQTIKLILLN